jgi:hypothetical protein
VAGRCTPESTPRSVAEPSWDEHLFIVHQKIVFEEINKTEMLKMSVLSFYSLLLLVSGGICASWKHVNADNFRTSVKENDLTLVACEF